MASAARHDVPEPPDFDILKRLARDQLIYLLEQLPGRKDLFIEADLMSPLDRIANVSILKQHEVDKLYKVESRPALSTSDQLCFLVRPRVKTMKYIADIVNADKMSGRSRKYKIIFSPQKFYACEMVLEEEGVFGDVTCDEWSFYLLPLDEDIISMELPEFFRDYFLEGDHRWINSVARALQLLNSLYGPFGRAYGIGRCAKMCYELWRDLEEESEGDSQGRNPEIGNIFFMDRDTDYVTALCSQMVYEGLVDDTFRIKCGSVDFGPEVTSSDKSVKVLLNAQDKVFSQIRNEHFSSVFGFLSQKSRNLQAQYDRRRGMDIKQMKNFVSQELKGLKQEHRLLSLHIGACESIMKKKTKQDFQEMIKAEHSLLEGFDIRESTSFIEEHIDRQVSPIESLRLMCLLSITENGLNPKDYRSLKTQYLQSYGPEHLLTFHNLKRIGLLTEQAAGETLTAVESRVSKLVTDRAAGKITDAFNSLARKSNFRAISKKLGLIPRLDGEYDLKVPRDMAYVFSGAYTPLSCKLMEQVLERRGWQGLEEVLRLLGGPEFSEAGGGAEAGPGRAGGRTVLAVFLGGCTCSEMAALRFLGRDRGTGGGGDRGGPGGGARGGGARVPPPPPPPPPNNPPPPSPAPPPPDCCARMRRDAGAPPAAGSAAGRGHVAHASPGWGRSPARAAGADPHRDWAAAAAASRRDWSAAGLGRGRAAVEGGARRDAAAGLRPISAARCQFESRHRRRRAGSGHEEERGAGGRGRVVPEPRAGGAAGHLGGDRHPRGAAPGAHRRGEEAHQEPAGHDGGGGGEPEGAAPEEHRPVPQGAGRPVPGAAPGPLRGRGGEHHPADGEGFAHPRASDVKAEEGQAAGAESSARTRPRPVRHPLRVPVWHRQQRRAQPGGAGPLPAPLGLPERREGERGVGEVSLGGWGRCPRASHRARHLQERRREEFVSIKRQVILCMEELDHTPDTSFEREVVCEDEEAFCLSTDNIAALQNLLQQVRWHLEAALL
uniref:Vacuolar protein sorting-associated protein 33B n=1 Tax=Anas platyrhynchos platyrhynchos TaxID=8840 RepID=A0A493T5B8_ANAPP